MAIFQTIWPTILAQSRTTGPSHRIVLLTETMIGFAHNSICRILVYYLRAGKLIGARGLRPYSVDIEEHMVSGMGLFVGVAER